MSATEPREGAQEIRAVLANAKEPMSVGEIFAACDTIVDTTAVASMLCEEFRAGRAERTGTRGQYRYALTEEGKVAAANPRFLRSRFNRRTSGRSARPKANLAALAAKAAAASKAAPAKKAARKSVKRRVPKPAKGARRGRPPGSKNKAARAAAAHAPAAPTRSASVSTGDDGARLAATVIACWPGPLDDMPDNVARQLRASLPIRITGA